MKVSIVVPAYNAEETLDACLEAILVAVGQARAKTTGGAAELHPAGGAAEPHPAGAGAHSKLDHGNQGGRPAAPGDYEVIVVDDGSEDGTARIALEYPVRLVRLPENRGRIRAREEGVRTAAAERVLLVDSRVLVPPDCLRVLEELDYEPVMGRVDATRERDSEGLNRLLFLIRRKIYRPYYPIQPLLPEVLVTADNFDRVPKGLGCFFVSRSRFLRALPDDRSPYVSDDTRLLEKIVEDKEVLATGKLVVDYLPRTDRAESFRHIFERGPRFADFHLRPGMRYYPLWVLGWLLAAAAIAGVFVAPVVTATVVGTGLVLLLVAGVYLAERPAEALRVVSMLPLLAAIFGLGVLHGKFYQFLRAPPRTWNRRLALASVFIAGILVYTLQRQAFADLAAIRWPLLALLSLLHLTFLAVNGLVLRSFLQAFEVKLEPKEWFGIASVSAMTSYLASGAGGLLTRAAILKHGFRLDYREFLAVLSANYALNALLASVLGLALYGVSFPEQAVRTWQVPAFLVTVALTTATLGLLRPTLPARIAFARGLIQPVYDGWEILAARKRLLARVAALLLVNFVLNGLTLMAGFAVFGRSLEPDAAMLVSALSSFSIFVAVTPANLGIQEGITASLTYLVGYGFHEGLAAVAVARAAAMLNIFLLGPAFSYVLLRRRRRLPMGNRRRARAAREARTRNAGA